MKFGGLMLHHFHDAFHTKGQGSISADDFENILVSLGVERFLTPDEWSSSLKNNSFRGNELCITFDDNLLCQYDVALPILEKYGLKAYFFIYTSPLTGVKEKLEIYRYFRSAYFTNINDFYEAFYEALQKSPYAFAMNEVTPSDYLIQFSFYSHDDRRFRFLRDQILGVSKFNEIMDKILHDFQVEVEQISKKLWMSKEHLVDLVNRGHTLGLHSHTHPTRFESLTLEQQRQEYSVNLKILSDITGDKITACAHPCNSYNHHTFEVLKSLGIKLAFRSNLAKMPYSNFELPRQDHVLVAPEKHPDARRSRSRD